MTADLLAHFLDQFADRRAEGITAALRALVRRRAFDWVLEAELAWEVHTHKHWQAATDAAGAAYPDEETYYEDVMELRTWRTIRKRWSIGAALERVPPEDRVHVRQDFATIGKAKSAVLAPLLDSWGGDWDAARWAIWRDLATGSRPDVLQRHVSDALAAKPRGIAPPGHTFRNYIVAKMPDLDSQQLAEEFFKVGARVADSANPIAVIICGFQECLAAWQPKVGAPSQP